MGVATERGGGWGITGMGVSDGVGDGVGVGVGVRAGIRVGAGARLAVSGMGGCEWVVGSRGAIDASRFVVMATATVIVEGVCSVTGVGGVDGTITIRAVLLRIASGDGSGFGGGLSP